jgi:hypothetical protein
VSAKLLSAEFSARSGPMIRLQNKATHLVGIELPVEMKGRLQPRGATRQ